MWEESRHGRDHSRLKPRRRETRVIPVIKALAREFPDVLISIDTYKAVIAEEALNEGAQVVNDVWALRADPKLKHIVAKSRCAVILMHNRSNPASVEVRAQLGNAYIGAEYDDLIEDVKRELMDSVNLAREAGVSDDRIILDPGIGFGKKVSHNLELINRLDEIRTLGFPGPAWAIAQIVHRLYSRPASRPKIGRHGCRRSHWDCTRRRHRRACMMWSIWHAWPK